MWSYTVVNISVRKFIRTLLINADTKMDRKDKLPVINEVSYNNSVYSY